MSEGNAGPISIENTTGSGIWNRFLGWIGGLIPFASGILGSGFLASQFGDSIPEWARPITNIFAGLYNRVINLVRGVVSKEELAADQGMAARINGNEIFTNAAEAVGGTAAQQSEFAADLRSVVQGYITRNTGVFGMNVNDSYAIEQSIALRGALTTRIVNELKQRNQNWGDSDLPRFNQIAEEYANAISGVDSGDTGSVNPRNASGYLGMLSAVQRGVAAEGEYRAEEVPQLSIVLRQAGVTPAPETGAPTTAPAPSAPQRQQG